MDHSCRNKQTREELEPFMSYRGAVHPKRNWCWDIICQSPWQQKLFVHFVLILGYTLVFVYILVANLPRRDGGAVTSTLHLSAREAIQLEIRPFKTRLTDNPFTGSPRPELDAAWHNLLQHNTIQIPSDRLHDLELESIHLNEGSASIASLSVYHALHCLKKIRQWTHKDYYYSGADSSKIALETRHVDHCIEYIRESLMCKPDVSPVTFTWINGTSGNGPLAPTNRDVAMHECANWVKLDNWAGERVFDLYRLDLLQKPS